MLTADDVRQDCPALKDYPGLAAIIGLINNLGVAGRDKTRRATVGYV